MRYYAHSGPSQAVEANGDLPDGQLLRDHLRGVAYLAALLASQAVPGADSLIGAASAAGLLHDLGKYRQGFQDYIRRKQPRTPRADRYHKQAGAALVFREKNYPIALVILGHHGGIPDGSELKQLADAINCPAGLPALDSVWPVATADYSKLLDVPLAGTDIGKGFRADLFTRVLFSCLVDADWADTGEHERKVRGRPAELRPPQLDPGERLKQVQAFIAGRASRTELEPHVKDARAEVYASCLAAADQPPGLFSLTVPTGGGKTLAALAFSLKHAAAHGLRRVVYVAPYMTILEQNADAIRAALGVGAADTAVFEHYSLADPPADDPEETRPGAAARRAENWDAPVVITTNVQFFESLFSNKPGRCRKVHNIARSVVILDECQTLPPGLAAPTCGMLKQLTTDLGCTIVLCTATQPAFDHDKLQPDERLTATPIVEKPEKLFEKLKRVELRWPAENEERMTWEQVAAEMTDSKSASLCVVNTKKAARAVFDALRGRGVAGTFHLSTGMCPQHRREKLSQIRSRLQDELSCYVVSTQLIEAGVDVDFPVVLREMAPLESVIQAAGRCNREGKLTDESGNRIHGQVLVFRSEEDGMPPDEWYKKGRSVLEVDFLNDAYEPQIDNPEDIRSYYRKLYRTGKLDKTSIQAKRLEEKYATVASDYKLIKDDTVPVVVETWESHREEIASLLAQIEKEKRPRKELFRRLALFQVNVWRSDLDRLKPHTKTGPKELLIWTSRYDEAVGIVEEIGWDTIV